ncbi:arylamine N-acetyltransferase 1, partial [Diplocarpon rosae]
MSFSHRPTYTLPALKAYLSHISLPASSHTHNALLQAATSSGREWAASSAALTALGQLQMYQQSKIPFANLYLHYSRHHVGTLNPGELYEYLVSSRGIAVDGGGVACESVLAAQAGPVQKQASPAAAFSLSPTVAGLLERERKWEGRGPSGGRGGTCSANNTFFGTVMRSFGMRVMASGARVAATVIRGEREKGRFNGWTHMINLVTFEGKRWLVDVGFVAIGPTTPIELIHGNEVPWGATGDRLRLLFTAIPEFEDPDQRCWVLQHKGHSKREWKDLYCFTETEFIPQDIAVMNFKSTGDVRGSFFNHVAFCGRNIVEEGRVVGTVNLAGAKCKRKIWREGEWQSEVVGVCESEVDRWEMLESVFGIVLGNEERKGIKGLESELKG